MLRMLSLAVIATLCYAGSCFAFSDTGHHVIAVIAFELLSPEEQAEIIRILGANPRFERDFTPPESIADDPEAVNRWRIGVAGEWPDIIRGTEEYDRPTWHYELGACISIGDVEVPEFPGPLPENATLETKELYMPKL